MNRRPTGGWLLPLMPLALVLPGVVGSGHAQPGLAGQWIAFSRAGGPTSDLQCFAPENVRVLAGNLIIDTMSRVATCSSYDLSPAPHNYTSGFVAMRSFNFLYGTVEFRAKFGGGLHSGAWPAVWMADASCQASDPDGTDEKCNQQEIDIAEILKSDIRHVNQQIHVGNFSHNDGCTASVTGTTETFHVYRLVWSPGSLVFGIDGETTCTLTSYVPDAAMYVKLDVNVGRLGGSVNERSLPWATVVDYLRVTQGSTIVFNDEFDRDDTVLAAPAHVPSAKDSPAPPRRHRIRWGLVLLGSCLVSASVLAVYRLRSKHQRRAADV